LEKKDEISFFHLKELNILIDFYEELSFAGQLRMKNIVIGGTNYQPPIPNKQNISELINELLNMPPSFENGIKIMAKLSKIQCFNNGNKRTALVFANFLLIKNNLPIIHIKNHEEYIHRLVDYYNDELQLNTFIACVKQMQENQYSNKNSDVSKLIKINMLNRNLTQYQLAKKCGIDSGFLSRIINKKAKLSINVAKKIADVLNIN
jgi:prophage maintenance system killer protein